MERILLGLGTPTKDEGSTLLVVDLLTGATLQKFTDVECRAHTVSIFGGTNIVNQKSPNYILVSHPYKATLIVYRRDNPTPFWRAAIPEMLTSTIVHPMGHFIFGGGGSGSLYVWHAPTGCLMRNLTPHARAVSCLAFSADGSLLFSVGEEGGVYAYRTHELVDVSDLSPKPIINWLGHTAPIVGIVSSLSPIGGILGGWVITAAKDRTLYVWNFEISDKTSSLLLPSEPTCLGICPNGLWVYVGCVDGRIVTVDLRALVERPMGDISTSNDLFGHSGPVKSIDVNWDGSLVISAANDGVRVWDTQTRRTYRHYFEKGNVAVLSVNFFVDCPNITPCVVPTWRPLARNLVKPSDLKEIIVVSQNRQRKLQHAYMKLMREEADSDVLLEQLSAPLAEALNASDRDNQLQETKANVKRLAQLSSEIFGHLLNKVVADRTMTPKEENSFLASVLGLGNPGAIPMEAQEGMCHPSQEVCNVFAEQRGDSQMRYTYAEKTRVAGLLQQEEEAERQAHFVDGISDQTPTESPTPVDVTPSLIDLSEQSLRLIRPKCHTME